jgi:hypothetical protein
MVNNNNNIEDQRWKVLDKERFQTFFDSDGRLVKEHEFRKAVFKGERYVSVVELSKKTYLRVTHR